MEYNWADPKKNSKIKSLLMLKAEASRKKRLTSVKSAVSNQMAPGTAQNVLLRKKKRTTDRPDSGRDPTHDAHVSPTADCVRSGNNGSGARSSTSRLHSRSNESTHATCSSRLLEDFDSHAAAEGLFHPASMIEAFLEHDTKYVSVKPNAQQSSRVGGSASTSTGEYPPSREHQKLPILGAVDVNKRERLSSRSEVQLHYADSSSRSSLSSTRSDSDLHAPRRTGSVPSSADRSALDFLDQSEEEEDCVNAQAATAKAANQRVLHARSKTSPPDFKSLSLQSKPLHAGGELDLTSKFDALKQMVKANAQIHGTAAYRDEPPPRRTKATASNGDSAAATHTERSSSHPNAKTVASKKSTKAVDPQRQGTTAHTSKAVDSIVATIAPRAKIELKIHNGVSLSDLKKEHRAALELLQELGGPIDMSEQLTEETVNKVKPTRASKQATTTTSHSTPSPVVAPRQSSPNHDLVHKAPSPSLSQPQQSLNHSQSSGKLVAKLRASVPSGRDKYKAHSPELYSPESPEREEVTYRSDQRQQPDSTYDNHDLISGSVELEQCLKDSDANQAQALVQGERESGKCSPEPAQQALDESWKQYEDEDQQADEDEGENNDDLDPWTSKLDDGAALSRSGMSTARSTDLYGDEAFENEW